LDYPWDTGFRTIHGLSKFDDSNWIHYKESFERYRFAGGYRPYDMIRWKGNKSHSLWVCILFLPRWPPISQENEGERIQLLLGGQFADDIPVNITERGNWLSFLQETQQTERLPKKVFFKYFFQKYCGSFGVLSTEDPG
jgi:hypothetical protein